MSRCAVRGCRFRHTHQTRAHRCGTCGDFGHGQLECSNPALRDELRSVVARERSVPTRHTGYACTVCGCRAPHTHDSTAHFCTTCTQRGTCLCPPPVVRAPATIDLTNDSTVVCPHCRQTCTIGEVVFTDAACCVCLEDVPLVVLQPCRHARVCEACARRMASD